MWGKAAAVAEHGTGQTTKHNELFFCEPLSLWHRFHNGPQAITHVRGSCGARQRFEGIRAIAHHATSLVPSIKDLQDELGLKLFCGPTVAADRVRGAELLAQCRMLLGQADALIEQAHSLRLGDSGVLSVGRRRK
jgi:hypothetical protein